MPYKMVSWISGMSIPYKGIIFQCQPHSLRRCENEANSDCTENEELTSPNAIVAHRHRISEDLATKFRYTKSFVSLVREA